MSDLESFTAQQRREIKAYLQPLRIRFWFILIGFLAGATLGFAGYTHSQETDAHRACLGEQRLAKVITIAIPQHAVTGRTTEQQHNVDLFYHELTKLGILTTPDC